MPGSGSPGGGVGLTRAVARETGGSARLPVARAAPDAVCDEPDPVVEPAGHGSSFRHDVAPGFVSGARVSGNFRLPPPHGGPAWCAAASASRRGGRSRCRFDGAVLEGIGHGRLAAHEAVEDFGGHGDTASPSGARLRRTASLPASELRRSRSCEARTSGRRALRSPARAAQQCPAGWPASSSDGLVRSAGPSPATR